MVVRIYCSKPRTETVFISIFIATGVAMLPRDMNRLVPIAHALGFAAEAYSTVDPERCSEGPVCRTHDD